VEDARFSAKLGNEVRGGALTAAQISRVRDVVLCLSTVVTPEAGDVQAHPPVGGLAARRGNAEVAEEIDLGLGITIGRLRGEDEKLVVNACDPRGHYFFPIRHNIVRHAFVRDVPAPWESDLYNWDGDGRLFRALSLSRLIRDNGYSLNYAARLVDYEDGEQMVAYLPNPEGKAAYRMRDSRDWFDTQDGLALRSLLASFWAIEPTLPSRLGQAMWRMEYASRLEWADVAVLILVSGLESLLKTERHHATAQFKQRVPRVAEELGIADVDPDFCGRMYQARSDWAHGTHVRMFSPPPPTTDDTTMPATGGPASNDEREGLAEVALIQDVLRGLVRRCIEDDAFRATFHHDRLIRERWPVTT
jgi:hypothetical protein